jgi:hypothetical protein
MTKDQAIEACVRAILRQDGTGDDNWKQLQRWFNSPKGSSPLWKRWGCSSRRVQPSARGGFVTLSREGRAQKPDHDLPARRTTGTYITSK